MGLKDKLNSMGLKDKLSKMKDGAALLAKATSRLNSIYFFGRVNFGVKDGDFWEGSYVNVEDMVGVIYSTAYEDYTFTADDIEKFELQEDCKPEVAKGGDYYKAKRFFVTFKDGKVAQMDLLENKVDIFKNVFNIVE
ncbi:MAG: hypothetical protein IKU66_03580 [Clostridia bacterium]|nr:hypothetical protein [Clostridia bacterium]